MPSLTLTALTELTADYFWDEDSALSLPQLLSGMADAPPEPRFELADSARVILAEVYRGADYIRVADAREAFMVAAERLEESGDLRELDDVCTRVLDSEWLSTDLAAAVFAYAMQPRKGRGSPAPWLQRHNIQPRMLYLSNTLKQELTGNSSARVQVRSSHQLAHSAGALAFGDFFVKTMFPQTGSLSRDAREKGLVVPSADALRSLKYRPDVVGGVRFANLLDPLAEKSVLVDELMLYDQAERPEVGLQPEFAEGSLLFSGEAVREPSGDGWADLSFIGHPLALMRSIAVPRGRGRARGGLEYQRTVLGEILLTQKLASLWAGILCGAFDFVVWEDEDFAEAKFVSGFFAVQRAVLQGLHDEWMGQWTQLNNLIDGYANGVGLSLPEGAPGLEYLQAGRAANLPQIRTNYSKHDRSWNVTVIGGGGHDGLGAGHPPINSFELIGTTTGVWHKGQEVT